MSQHTEADVLASDEVKHNVFQCYGKYTTFAYFIMNLLLTDRLLCCQGGESDRATIILCVWEDVSMSSVSSLLELDKYF